MERTITRRIMAEGTAVLRRREILLGLGITLFLPARALAEPFLGRRISLKNTHTGETFAGPYRDVHGPIPEAMADLAVFLRDHHSGKEGPVDVGTLDFLADVMEAVGLTGATVLSAYRTPETNRKLAARMFGVAEKSQHLFGRAIDVSFDKKLADAEKAARGLERGGVGWYPGSRFIHLDTGPVRSWSMGGGGLEGILGGGRARRPLTVRERMAAQRALARREYYNRLGGRGLGRP